KEIAFELAKWSDRLDIPHHQMARMEARLQEIDALKKKYGESVTHILAWKNAQEMELKKLLAADEVLEELESAILAHEQALEHVASDLSEKRTSASQELSSLMTQQLRELNMPHATFTVALTPCERGSFGDETVTFFLAANRGEAPVDIQHGASG